jgi:NAD-dependent dihydropyrimidine dehydrogenase PreA subunit
MLVVNEDKCIGCGQCVPFCPDEALEAWGVAKVKREDCTDCLICVDYCPVDALEVWEESRI